jgi:hypothetical protein
VGGKDLRLRYVPYLLSLTAFCNRNATDYDSYLTPATMTWCQQTLESIGHSGQPQRSEFFTVNGNTIPPWYEQLLLIARAHDAAEAFPPLELAPRPFVDLRRDLIREICQEFDIDPAQCGLIPEER